jgi:uncharacterized protein YdhG (YjbR/CyaY superfamily)
MPNEGKRESPWKSILAKDIDEYLALLPDEPRKALQHLRRTIGTAAPEALEKIYYRIPTFMDRGPLVGFSASADHGSLHLMSPPLMKAHQDELGSYDTSAATIRFPYDDPLPDALVEMLVKERVLENEKRAKM